MYERNIFQNISPLDHRYWLANNELFTALSELLSEEGMLKLYAQVEARLLLCHARYQSLDSAGLERTLATIVQQITPQEVYEEEGKTRHFIRALVRVLQRKVEPSLAHLVHVGATSYDIIETARSLALQKVMKSIIVPLLIELVGNLCTLSATEASTYQVGRTHGQHALPITFGFAMAEYVSRLGSSLLQLCKLYPLLPGKLSGAVGCYNGLSLLYPDAEEFEKEFLFGLGLYPASYSSQIVEPEPVLRLLLEINISFGIIANLADDLRQLQRSEIDEVKENSSDLQVGSSTMPHKQNPWNSEHVKSLWKAFCPRTTSFFMDQISEHQRDLTNSASTRFIADYLAGFVAAAARMRDIIRHLQVNTAKMQENLESNTYLLAEAAYILISRSAENAEERDAHEKIRLLCQDAKEKGIDLRLALQNSGMLDKLKSITIDGKNISARDFFSKPQYYSGLAASKTARIASFYTEQLRKIKQELQI